MGMVWLLVVVAALAWCVVPLPLTVAVGRSLRRSSEDCESVLVESLAESPAA